MDLSIIIVNWNSVNFLRVCLTSIFDNVRALEYEVIVIDNASFDGSATLIAAEFPQVHFLQSERNLGFSGANNLALEHAQGRYVLFLNPDTRVLADAVQVAVSALDEHSEAAMAGVRLLNPDLTLQTTCVTAVPSILNQVLSSDHLRESFPGWRLWGMRALFRPEQAPVAVEAVSGACMLARRHIIKSVGGFTTAYFMYSEDMDLCVKIHRAGHDILYVPGAEIIHFAGRSSSSREESNFSNVMLRESVHRFFELHRGRGYASLYRLSTSLMALARLAVLGIAAPAVIVRGQSSFLQKAISKWWAVLGWSLGMSRWVHEQRFRAVQISDVR
jgi:N-acetylglucosaminyl-diphospho-decaprenol L-rhamnosyltransferase